MPQQDAAAQQEYDQAYEQGAADAQQQYAPPPQAPPPAPQEDVISQIERLGALKDQGLLTEEEFAAQKAETSRNVTRKTISPRVTATSVSET